MVSTDLRLRFDDEFDEILDDLREISYFADLASIALFCAALGSARHHRSPRTKGSRDVRIQLILNIPGAASFMDAIALIHLSSESDPLSAERLEERLGLLEEFANGGLSLLTQMKNSGHLLSAAIPAIISDQVRSIRRNNE